MSIILKYIKVKVKPNNIIKVKPNNIINELIISDHSCYILLSLKYNKYYIGYTTDFKRRLRQHNCEIKGGAKKTRKWKPWKALCHITGFVDKSTALRFEYRLQHPIRKKKKSDNHITYIINILKELIYKKDGSIINNNLIDWPIFTIKWYSNIYNIEHPNVINTYL